MAGSVGFTIPKSVPSILSPTIKDDQNESTQFGSPGDFKRAIQDLQFTFSLDANKVSVDPDDLHVHGFSANDHHPGMYVAHAE